MNITFQDFVLVTIVGTSRTGKSTLVSRILKSLGIKPVVYLADKKTKSEIYRATLEKVSFGRRSTMYKGDDIFKWRDQNAGKWVVIEDITPAIDREVILTVRNLLTVRRINLVLVCQNMKKMNDFIAECRYFAFFHTDNKVNMKQALGGDYKRVGKQVETLRKGEFIIADSWNQTFSEVYTNDLEGANRVIDSLQNGVNGSSYASLPKKPREKSKGNVLRDFAKYVLMNFEKTTWQMAKELDVSMNAISQRIFKCKNAGWLPNKDKREWTREDVFLYLLRLNPDRTLVRGEGRELLQRKGLGTAKGK